MNTRQWRVMSILTLLLMAATLVASTLLGGCGGQLELASGGNVPMKCHWAFMATAFTSLVGCVSATCAFFSKGTEARRMTTLLSLIISIACGILPSSAAIGVCGGAEMGCQTTTAIIWALTGCAAIISIVQLMRADPMDAQKPKMHL